MQEFSATVFLVESWTDERLKFTARECLRLSGEDISKIWIPDVFFPYETGSKMHEVTVPNLKVVLNGTGVVELVLR